MNQSLFKNLFVGFAVLLGVGAFASADPLLQPGYAVHTLECRRILMMQTTLLEYMILQQGIMPVIVRLQISMMQLRTTVGQ